jgi:hypothetical protein
LFDELLPVEVRRLPHDLVALEQLLGDRRFVGTDRAASQQAARTMVDRRSR